MLSIMDAIHRPQVKLQEFGVPLTHGAWECCLHDVIPQALAVRASEAPQGECWN
jgi:hypothetical protein